MDNELVTFSRAGTTLIARICCEIDHHTAARIRTRIDRAIFLERPKAVCLNFKDVRFMDSSGIALILGRVETSSAVGASVHLDGLSPALYKLVRLSGIERVKNLTVLP